ncbi:hypothetical protein Bphy_6286 (plasmid) [Paraburkholderia phymatum STM815]|uniref:Uncharacterized protein n=1 Tax=Paraburkholderia phymatum (strain DSM 17167 / CIP 108236 / LMG 21445 / STM815) TaxID=391038 RepID=B2JWJ3_PARP8|nr:hypothetical protein Bphy_6286 [Paraburkholderia phymatum STM815]
MWRPLPQLGGRLQRWSLLRISGRHRFLSRGRVPQPVCRRLFEQVRACGVPVMDTIAGATGTAFVRSTGAGRSISGQTLLIDGDSRSASQGDMLRRGSSRSRVNEATL